MLIKYGAKPAPWTSKKPKNIENKREISILKTESYVLRHT